MERTNRRLYAIGSVVRWFILAIFVVAVVVQPPPGLHTTAFFGFILVGLVPGIVLPLLPWIAPKTVSQEQMPMRTAVLLLVFEAVFVSGIVWATGGVAQPYWMAWLVVALAAGWELPIVGAAFFALGLGGLAVGMTALADTPLKDQVGNLVIVAGVLMVATAVSKIRFLRAETYRQSRRQTIAALERQTRAIESAFALVADGDLSATVV